MTGYHSIPKGQNYVPPVCEVFSISSLTFLAASGDPFNPGDWKDDPNVL